MACCSEMEYFETIKNCNRDHLNLAENIEKLSFQS